MTRPIPAAAAGVRWPRVALALPAALLLSGQMLAICLAGEEPEYYPGIEREPLFKQTLDVRIPKVTDDPAVTIDYDIVYVRAGRAGDEVHKRYYTDFSQPVTMEPGADLMLLHPDGSEELLVEGGDGSITDPAVSFDAQWVYFTRIYDLQKRNQWNPPSQGADIFKIHLKTRRIVRLTNQVFTPNTGAGNWTEDFRPRSGGRNGYSYGVFNMGAHPLPGGRIVFSSNRDGFRPSKGYPAVALQLFVMDDREESVGEHEQYPANIEKIGHLNAAGALHPVVLRDGRIIFSSLESQGIRSSISWGIWSIHPDGTNWGPVVSAFDPGGASNGFHFQTQTSNGSIVVEEYYNQNNSGFGAYIRLPEKPPAGYAAFGPAWPQHERNRPWRFGRHYNGKGRYYRMPFMPSGSVSLTPFSLNGEGPADPSVLGEKKSPAVGKFTHPSGAPDNHLLTVYSPGPVNHQYRHLPQFDGGLYLLLNSEVVTEPAELRLIRNDPNYNESWPRAVVPYERIYGVPEPARLPELANDGSRSKLLPAGTPFGLVGTSSFYKRESYPNGVVPEGKVTAEYAGGNDPWKGLDAFTSHGNGMPRAWHTQGGDVGLYSNDEIHAVRILAMPPTTDRRTGDHSGRRFHSHATERLRILGEIPLRKFGPAGQPLDPDGNPDTSFLARIPADVAFTFQTIDARGLVLNNSQTWHQLRPGEIRHDCGGCHAHSQQPTDFALTAAAKDDYSVWDLTDSTPLVTSRDDDTSAQQWDTDSTAGLREVPHAVVNVEYHRDIRPILARSCAACHSSRDGRKPAGNLDLDADDELIRHDKAGEVPGTYFRLALDGNARFGYPPLGYSSWGYPNASRYIRMLQARRSLLVWKIFGQRLDGFSNDDHPSEPEPGAGYFAHHGEKLETDKYRARYDLDYLGSAMPPAAAVKSGKVQPLTDADRRTIARWIDLGCPIDLDYDAAHPEQLGFGWMLDDDRPTLTLAEPAREMTARPERILIGLHDYETGLDPESLQVTADFPVDGQAPGTNLVSRFRKIAQGVLEYRTSLPGSSGTLTVSVRDRQGNESKIVRRYTVRPAGEGN